MRERFMRGQLWAVLVFTFGAAEYAAAGTITFGNAGSTGARVEVIVNGTTFPVTVTSSDGADAAQQTRDAINRSNLGLTATLDKDNPKRVNFPGGKGVGVRVLDGCIDNEYHSDPEFVSFAFLPGFAAGTSCGGSSGTAATLFVNDFSIVVLVSTGQSTQDLVQAFALSLTQAGFQLSVSALELNVLQMPNGIVPTDGGFSTNDSGLVKAAPLITSIPEPKTVLLIGSGVIAFAVRSWLKRPRSM